MKYFLRIEGGYYDLNADSLAKKSNHPRNIDNMLSHTKPPLQLAPKPSQIVTVSISLIEQHQQIKTSKYQIIIIW